MLYENPREFRSSRITDSATGLTIKNRKHPPDPCSILSDLENIYYSDDNLDNLQDCFLINLKYNSF